MKFTWGKYNGIDYKRVPMSDVFFVESRKVVWITFKYGQPTGDMFETKREMIKAIDAGGLNDERHI